MNKLKLMIKTKSWLIPIIILGIIMLIPSTWALYHTQIESPLTTKFKIEYNSVFIRAHIITYWEDIESGNIAAKSSWNINNNVINNNWTKIDDYYYYNGTLTNEEITDGIPVGYELISPELTVEELSTEDLTDLKNIAKYKIMYEYIEAEAISNTLSSEDAWKITYSEDGIPSKIA